MICTTCKSKLGAHFQLNRIEASGAVQGTVLACSLICLVKWAYSFGAQRTAMGVVMAKHMVGSVLAALRGAPGNPR